MANHKGKFPGFPPEPVTNFWPYPKALNGWWHMLSAYEQKVLDYILRHTWGYNKVSDSISHSQFIRGITKRDGTIVDRGTGIKDSRTLSKATKRLSELGFIEIDRTLGKENKYTLKMLTPQTMLPPTTYEGSPLTNNVGSNHPQQMSSTIDNIPINNISATRKLQKTSYKEEIQILISYLSTKLGGVTFPNQGKQAKYIVAMLTSNYNTDDICWTIDKLLENPWWRERGFDMQNVANEIAKLMASNNKTVKAQSKPKYIPCKQNGCEDGYIRNPNSGGMSVCTCREQYNYELRTWEEKWK